MNQNRREFVRKVMISAAGLSLAESVLGQSGYRMNTDEDRKIIFPFMKYVPMYNIGEYIPKDQGGKFIQQVVLGTEDDKLIVEKIRGGLLESVYGNPVDWGKLEKTELEKSVWLNRFYYLPSFARQYYLTGDKACLDYMMDFIRRWIRENPRDAKNSPSKYNWYDMQVAWRAIHLSWCLYLTEGSLSPDDKSLIFHLQEEHSQILLDHFGGQSLNEFNHQAHGALAMLYLGVLFPDLPQSEELIEVAKRILNHHTEHAFYSDGGNVEQMFGYYPFEAHLFRDALLLFRSKGIAVPEQLPVLLRKMFHFLSAVAQPDGTMPPVNDSYPMPVGPILVTIADVLEINVSESWRGSAYFQDTQLGILKSSGIENNWYLLVNPAKTIGAHAHAGRLSFNLWYNNRPFIIDSGCCNYDDPMLVKWYRTTQAHNSVLIDRKSDPKTSGPEQWAAKRQTENRITYRDEESTHIFCQMNSPADEPANLLVNWSRSIAVVKNLFVVVHDHFGSDEAHEYAVLLHTPVLDVEKDGDAYLLTNGDEKLALFYADNGNESRTEKGEGLISQDGTNVMAPVFTRRIQGKDVYSTMVFYPVQQTGKVQVEQEVTNEGAGLHIKTENGETYVVIFRNQDATTASFGGHSTSKIFAVFEQS